MKLASLLLVAVVTALPSHAIATDLDGPDCGRLIEDFGDAPEGFSVFGPVGTIGHFPTCLAPGAPGTQETTCAPISSPPGATGYMRNVQTGNGNYWLGAYQTEFIDPLGIDSERDGKSNPSGLGPSACDPAVAVDCDAGFPFSAGQDDCPFSNDAGLLAPFDLLACEATTLQFSVANCGPAREAYLNVLADWSMDGDWNDIVFCDPLITPCTYEWTVKNVPVTIPAGSGAISSPTFRAGYFIGYAWMRVSLTDVPVDDDFPWAGSALRPDGSYPGGETEDYRILVVRGDPARKSTWGSLKIKYL